MVILNGKWNTFQRSKHEMVMEIDSLPKLNSFFCFELELGIKIFSLGLTFLGHFPPSLILASFAGSFNNTFLWILYLPVLVNVYAFGLAFFALQCFRWKIARVLLIPAAILASTWSFVCLIYIVPIWVRVGSTEYFTVEVVVILSLYLLLEAILLAYYWVGLMALYHHKNMPHDSDSSLLVQELE